MENEKQVVKRTDLESLVMSRIEALSKGNRLHHPKNYSVDNAITSAFLMIQTVVDKDKKPALQVCTKESIANAVLDTVIQGLSPSKKQVSYIVRGKKLCCDRSYFGTIAVAKRIPGVIDCFAQPIYKGDEFEFKIVGARKIVVKHEQSLETISSGVIIGAYSTIIYKDTEGEIKESSEIMTMEEIKISWKKSQDLQQKVHNQFGSEMAKRTVFNRGCKTFINSSDDASLDLIIESFNKTDGREAVDDVPDETIIDATVEEPGNEPESTKRIESNHESPEIEKTAEKPSQELKQPGLEF